MAKQYTIEITYNDASTEEYIIHSDDTVEWVEQQSIITVSAFTRLLTCTKEMASWFADNNATRLEVTMEDED